MPLAVSRTLPTGGGWRFGCVSVGHGREEFQERADPESFLGGVPEWAVTVHAVPGTPPDPSAGDVAVGFEVGDDGLHGAVGEVDDRADVADAGLRVAGDLHQHVPMSGQQCPPAGAFAAIFHTMTIATRDI
jgi:proteasome lid subunit RPN8/RPN11